MDAGVIARHHLSGRVVDDDLNERRAAAWSHGLRGCLDRAAVSLTRVLGHADRGLGAGRNARHEILRYVDVDAKLAGIRDHEELGTARGPDVDEGTDVGFARGHYSVEW